MRNLDLHGRRCRRRFWSSRSITLIGVGIRLLVMTTVQQRRERANRQINERLRVLIAAYKTLGGSFTGNLAVDPTPPARPAPGAGRGSGGRRPSRCRRASGRRARAVRCATRSRRRCRTSFCSAPRSRSGWPSAPRRRWSRDGRSTPTTWSCRCATSSARRWTWTRCPRTWPSRCRDRRGRRRAAGAGVTKAARADGAAARRRRRCRWRRRHGGRHGGRRWRHGAGGRPAPDEDAGGRPPTLSVGGIAGRSLRGHSAAIARVVGRPSRMQLPPRSSPSALLLGSAAECAGRAFAACRNRQPVRTEIAAGRC